MSLTPEQKATVSTWIAAGDNLSTVQKKLRDAFQISMTYMDVRFLVDDLNLTLKDPAPKTDTSDVTKAKAPAKPAASAKPAPAPQAGAAGADDSADAEALEDDSLPPVPGNVVVEVDNMTLDPRAIASGSVRFSDGVTGKWIVDQQGRPGFTEISQPGYRPTPEDGQAFMQELDAALRQRGY
ncbi:MAG: hypothetical protein MUE42_00965 [Opitutaceae bacterium]|jgi:hypothetical protein|nr:hypothetical protein [Opitutaceae bacterium]